MKPIFVFNPEHDLALANGDSHYIPPKNIREMARDLSHLLAEALAPSLSTESPSNATACRLQPWGWDYAVVEHFKKMGVSSDELPSNEALASLCARSERATAHHLLHAFLREQSSDCYIGESVLLHNVNEICNYAKRYGHILLKAPLSGSGKGLRHLNLNDNESNDVGIDCNALFDIHSTYSSSLKIVKNWAEALIRRHGYFTAEPFYNKVADFAMEFCVRDSECQFIGYSLFNTDHHGRYIESLLMSDDAIEKLLVQYVPIDAFHEVRRWVITHWDCIVPTDWETSRHPLYFGIDMMIVDSQQPTDKSQENSKTQKLKLHPCVEINLRLNMGIVAHELYRHRLASGSRGVFRLAFLPDSQALRDFSSELATLYPAVYLEERLVSGYLPLTPIGEDTRHHAYILCE